jgi:hypothetical protein
MQEPNGHRWRIFTCGFVSCAFVVAVARLQQFSHCAVVLVWSVYPLDPNAACYYFVKETSDSSTHFSSVLRRSVSVDAGDEEHQTTTQIKARRTRTRTRLERVPGVNSLTSCMSGGRRACNSIPVYGST